MLKFKDRLNHKCNQIVTLFIVRARNSGPATAISFGCLFDNSRYGDFKIGKNAYVKRRFICTTEIFDSPSVVLNTYTGKRFGIKASN